jgi:branched-chain amino acid transport system substrate-binding protein
VGRRSAVALVLAALVAAGCGGKKKQEKVELKGTVTLGVLGPFERQGELGERARDLQDGAQMAVDEINADGGVLGRKLELQFVDDACEPQVAYEAAKSFLSDGEAAGVIGGMCDDAAEREITVIDSAGIPFLITHAIRDELVADGLQSTYWMTGTIYQQALSSVFWMNYQQAQRLAVLQDDSADSKALAGQAIQLVEGTPNVVSLQTIEPDGPPLETIAKAAVKAKPNFVLWTGGAKAGGALLKALRAEGYTGTFTATAASESQDFIDAAGDAADGAFVMATSTPTNTPTADPWRKQFSARHQREATFDAQQAYDSVRTLAHAITRAKSTDAPKMLERMVTIDPKFVNSLGVVRFAADHRLLYDNRVILKVDKGAFTFERSLRTDHL